MKWAKPQRRSAVALKYDTEKAPAPMVTATGRGELAERIIETAKRHGIPIIEDKPLVEALARVDIGRMIPVELYPVVAEILAWVYRQDGRAGRMKSR